MRLMVVGLALGFALVGCGGDEEPAPAQPSAAETSAADLTMRDACPLIEDAVPSNGFESPVEEFRDFAATLTDLRSQADTETANAIELAQPGTAKIIKTLERGDSGLFASEGEEAFLAGMADFGDRCGAAGSSAFQ